LQLEEAMIASNCATTTAEVSTYVREHLRDRAEARRKSIDVAIAAANERARINDALKIDADSSAGLTDVPKRMAALIAAATPDGAPPSVPGLPSHHRVAERSAADTMAALEAPPPSPARRRIAIVIVAAITVAAALILVFALGRTTATTPEAVKPAAAAPPKEPVAAPSPAPTPSTTPSPTVAVSAPVAKPKPAVIKTTKPVVKKPKVDDGF
jgi:hypothetical protein